MNGGKGSAKLKARPQVERFREVAQMIGADESEAAFDRTLRKIASAPPAPMPDKGKKPKNTKRSRS